MCTPTLAPMGLEMECVERPTWSAEGPQIKGVETDKASGKKNIPREPNPTGAAKGQNMRRMIRLDGIRESGYKGSERVRERIAIWRVLVKPLAAIGIEIF
ncbi:UNVERIFIED_CONTAM: hypothetical protein NCL1_38173 [Trichonephila clavipes]